MKKLNEFCDVSSDVLIKDIKTNSKDIEVGDLFVCIRGVNFDRHDFIDDAIERGASAIVVSRDIKSVSVPVVVVEDTNKELFNLVDKFYDFPLKNLKIIGVTGTNGKTTVAKILYDMLDDAAYIGTLGVMWKDHRYKINNTTPDIDYLFRYFKKILNDGIKIVVMEVSSEAFYRRRIDNIKFDISILTNITEDHLNVHKTLNNYIACKKKLFLNTKDDGICILNKDDDNYDLIIKNLNKKILTYGTRDTNLEILNIKEKNNKTVFEIKMDNQYETFVIPLIGKYNVYNFCACVLVMLSLGLCIKDIKERISNIGIVEGRGEFIDKGQDYKIILDYAHTTDALKKILSYLNSIKKANIITVTGSAGGREKEKRKYMGKVVLNMSNYVIFTMDDPRYENVNDIIDDLVSDSDMTNYERIIDRKEAIYKALNMAKKDDIVLIAGKGRDDYMAIKDEYLPYSDYDTILSYFE